MIGSSISINADKSRLKDEVENHIVKTCENFIFLSYANFNQYREFDLNPHFLYKNILFGFNSLSKLNDIENYVADSYYKSMQINNEANYINVVSGGIASIDKVEGFIYSNFYPDKFNQKLIVDEEDLPKDIEFFPIYSPSSIKRVISPKGDLEVRYYCLSNKDICKLCLTNYLDCSYFILLTLKGHKHG